MFVKIILICVILRYTSAQGVLNKQYKVENYFKANWFNANIFCRDHGMRLATITSDAEQSAIITLLDSTDKMYYETFWISATDLAEEGRYTWFSTGETVRFFRWSYDQPVRSLEYIVPEGYDNIEDCVQLKTQESSRNWATVNCTTPSYFICEV